MNKPIPFIAIGVFVVSALTLLVAGTLFFGSGKFFTSSHDYVLFFDQSVNGLYAESVVKFRGVEVGSVKRITLAGGDDKDPQIAVFIKLFDSSQLQEFEFDYDFSEPELVQNLIGRGLKAQLRSQNVLSGDLYISLDMEPTEDYEYVLPEASSYTEIPTVQSGLMEDFTASSMDISENLTNALGNLQRVLTNVDSKLDPLTKDSRATLKEMRKMFSTITQFLEPDSPFGHQAPKTLSEMERAAKAVRLLAEFIERNPSSIVFGRDPVETVPVERIQVVDAE